MSTSLPQSAENATDGGSSDTPMSHGKHPNDLFAKGTLTIDPDVLTALGENDERLETYMVRHVTGDWYHMGHAMFARNASAADVDGDVMSAFRVKNGGVLILYTDIFFGHTHASMLR